MADPKIEAVQRMYEAFGKGDIDAIMSELTDDVDWGVEPDSKIAPWHGRRTRAEVPAFFQAIYENTEVTEFTPLAFASNDTDVMVVVRYGFKVNATGKSGVMDIHHWFRFRDGKVYLVRGTEDTALVADALR
ncbi:MAG TPA: nuclear transport factor 2 family protein [Acidimicrobiales bacterium]|nr:nuclear transport factor 2 family protein [Acidimicrobiales bacterium]